MFKKRWITGTINRGIFKGKKFELEIGDRFESSHLKIDGKKVNEHITAVHIHMSPEYNPPRITIGWVDSQ